MNPNDILLHGQRAPENTRLYSLHQTSKHGKQCIDIYIYSCVYIYNNLFASAGVKGKSKLKMVGLRRPWSIEKYFET